MLQQHTKPQRHLPAAPEISPNQEERWDLSSDKNWRSLSGTTQSMDGKGNHLIVFIDANEYIYKESIGKELTDLEGLNMREVKESRTNLSFWRTNPIDNVWATSYVELVNICAMPVGYGVRDNRMFIVDFTTKSLVSPDPPKIARSAARRLNSWLEATSKNYIEDFEESIIKYCLLERLGKAHKSQDHLRIVQEKINKIDQESKDYMSSVEKKCWRIKSSCIPFSLEATVWIGEYQVHHSLLQWHAGKTSSHGNLKRVDFRCGISQLMHLSM